MDMQVAPGVPASDLVGYIAFGAVARVVDGVSTPFGGTRAVPFGGPYTTGASFGAEQPPSPLFVCTVVINGRASLVNEGRVLLRLADVTVDQAVPPGAPVYVAAREPGNAARGAFTPYNAPDQLPGSVLVGAAVAGTPGGSDARVTIGTTRYVACELLEPVLAQSAALFDTSPAAAQDVGTLYTQNFSPNNSGPIDSSKRPLGILTSVVDQGVNVAYVAWMPPLGARVLIKSHPVALPEDACYTYDVVGQVVTPDASETTGDSRWTLGLGDESAFPPNGYGITWNPSRLFFPDVGAP